MKRAFLALALLMFATSSAAQSSFIIDNRTGSDILVANGSTGDIGLGQRNPDAQLDILSNSPQVAFRVESNSGDTWLVNQNGGLQSSLGPRIVSDSNVGNLAYTDTGNTFITSGDDSSTDYDIVLDPSAQGRVNVSSNLNLRDNNLTNFFDQRCGEGDVVDSVRENGSYECVDVTGEIKVENLSKTLEAGNIANQTIVMDDNDITEIGNLAFDSNPANISNPSSGSIRLRGTGGASGNIFDVVEDSSGNTVAVYGDGTIGSEIRNPVSNEDIIRFNQSGGSDVQIPNGNLNMSSGNITSLYQIKGPQSDNSVIDLGSSANTVIRPGGSSGGTAVAVQNDNGNEIISFKNNNGIDVNRNPIGEAQNINFYHAGGNSIADVGGARIAVTDAGSLNLSTTGTSYPIRITDTNLDLDGNSLDEVGGTTPADSGAVRMANNVYVQARNSVDTGDIQVIGTDSSDNVQIGGNANIGNLELLNSQLNITRNDAIEIGYGDTKLYQESLYLSNGYGSDGLNISSAQGIRIDAGGPSSDGNLDFQNVGIQENSGVLELTGGETKVVDGNLNLNSNNITNLNEIQDYYDSKECGPFRAVKGIHPNGTYICTEEILEEKTEYLNETLEAGNFAGDNDIYMNQSQVLEIGTGKTNFTNTGGLDLGGDIEMSNFQLYNDDDSKDIDFSGTRINIAGGLDVENDAKLRDDIELELGTGTDYDLRMDSSTGNLVLRNGSNQILVADSNENLRVENGYLKLQENNIRDVGAIQDNSGTDSIVLDEANNVRLPNGNLDMDENQINDTSRLKNDGQLVLESDSQNAGSGQLILKTGGSDRLVVRNDGEIRVLNDDLNLSQNNLDDVSRINFESGSNTAYIEEQSGDQLAINSQGDVLRLQSANSNDVSVESNTQFNENNLYDLDAIQDGGQTDSIVFHENNSVQIPNGNLSLNQNNLIEFFDSNCATGEVVEQVYANGSYSCLDIDAADSTAQDLAEVLDVDNKAADDNINMTEQDITDLDQLRFNDNIEIGDSKTNSSASNALAVGKEASSTGSGSLAIGTNANSSNYQSVVVGTNAKDNGNRQSVIIGHSAQTNFNGGTAIGYDSEANGVAAALGSGSSATGIGSFAMGQNAAASARNSISIGRDASSSAKRAFALGYSSTADAQGAIAIGAKISSSQTNLTRIGRGEVEIPNGNLDVRGNNVTNIDEVSGDSEAIESQNDINMSNNDVNEANAVNFGNGASGERMVKTSYGDLCLGDECG